MTEFAGGQQSFAPQPNYKYPGDYYGIPGLAGTSTQGFGVLAATDVAVGGFAWIVQGLTDQYVNSQISQSQTPDGGSLSNQIVFVPRTNANVYSNSDLGQGWSFTIPARYQSEVASNGSFYAAITFSGNEGNVINVGDAVYANITDGTLAVGVSGNPAYVQTNYLVINNNVPNTFGLNMVVISNVAAI